eukprot:1931406-Lingulodinium_polyedra.AAC.1
MIERAATLLGSLRPASPAIWAAQWNTHCASLVLYHAHIALPPRDALKTTQYALVARASRRAL